jgi:hypothetical protein
MCISNHTRSRRRRSAYFAAGLSAVTALLAVPLGGWGQEPPPPAPVPRPDAAAVDRAEPEVLTSGPIHEAYAEPLASATIDLVVPAQPPEPIDEMPPDAKPAGDDVEWIGGYWAWDDDRNDFIWVSGVWRNIPPGMRWVPGYWAQVTGGWQWTPGFWAEAGVDQVTYYPPPPETLEEGPNSDPPSANHFWVPGTWVYVENDYRWRPGFWSQGYDNWMWVPSTYHYTPRGVVYVDGYWDYDWVNRGVLFAPIYARGGWGFPFVPRVVVDVGPLLVHLWVRPGYGHYYFGDYYHARYSRWFFPWYSWHRHHHHHFDPLWSYHSWRDRRDGRGDFFDRLDRDHRFFADNEDFRPRKTWREQREFEQRFRDRDEARRSIIARPLDDVVADRGRDFEKLPAERKQEIARRTKDLREFQRERREVEARADAGARVEGRGRQHTTLKLPPVEDRGDRAGRQPDTQRPDTQRPEVQRPDTQRPDVQRPETRRPDTQRPDTRRPDVQRPDTQRPQPDTRRPDVQRPDTQRPDTRRPDVQRPDTQRPDTRRPDIQRPETRRPETQRPDVPDRTVQPRPDRGNEGDRRPSRNAPPRLNPPEQPRSVPREARPQPRESRPQPAPETRPQTPRQPDRQPQPSRQPDARPKGGDRSPGSVSSPPQRRESQPQPKAEPRGKERSSAARPPERRPSDGGGARSGKSERSPSGDSGRRGGDSGKRDGDTGKKDGSGKQKDRGK